MYLLEKLRVSIPMRWGVIALQSSNNETIDLYSEYRESKLQALTKTVVTYKQIEVGSYNSCHCAHHKQGNQLLHCISFSFIYPSFLYFNFEGEPHEEKSILYDCFGMM